MYPYSQCYCMCRFNQRYPCNQLEIHSLHKNFFFLTMTNSITYQNIGGPGSSVSIATDYGLDGPGSNPGEDEICRPSSHPASCTMAIGSFPGVEAAGACG